MSIIYKITNLINNRCYIGKTELTIDKRFKQHLAEITKQRSCERPLYRAILKYGIDNFRIEPLEICEAFDASDREIYWIEHFDSYGNTGYNATKGGDGRSFVDIELIINTYIRTNSTKLTSELCGYHIDTIRKVLKSNNFILKKTGELVSNSILTAKDVENIRNLYVPKLFGKRKISKLLNLPLSAVSSVIEGRSWK